MTEIISYDERQGVPSASRLLRLKLCPGSYRAEKRQYSGRDQRPNSEADRGRRIHEAAKVIAMDADVSKLYPGANREEIEEAWKLWGIYKQIENQVFGDADGKQYRIIEKRFWLFDDGSNVLTGQIDIGAIHFNEQDQIWEGLICDYKTGWNDVDEADSNLQMRAYAVLLKSYGPELKRIIVAIIAPNQGRPTLTCYKERDLEIAKREILGILQEANLHDAPRIAGEQQCKYCPAKDHCAAYQEFFLKPIPIIKEFALASSAYQWTQEQRDRFSEGWTEVKKWGEARIAEIKELTREGKNHGWIVTEGKETQTITNVQEARSRLSDTLTPAQFSEACTASLPKLREIYAQNKKITKEDAKELLTEKLNGLIATKRSEGQLKRIK